MTFGLLSDRLFYLLFLVFANTFFLFDGDGLWAQNNLFDFIGYWMVSFVIYSLIKSYLCALKSI